MEQNQKRNGGNSSFNLNDWDLSNCMPSLDQVLSHLNKLRLNNTSIGFILTDKLLQTLRKIYEKYDFDDDDMDDESDLRKKYSDLFALAVDDFAGSSQQQRESSLREVFETANDDNDEDAVDDDDDDDDDNDDTDNYYKKNKSTRKSGKLMRTFL